MFVPSLLMDLRKLPTKDRDIKEQIPPLAQCLILYTLQIGFIQNTINEISELFGVSYSTANRAARWLQSKGFLFTGNSKKVQFRCLGHELWDKAFPYLTSPVEKTITVDKVPENSLLSGNSIIHNNTETYALYKDASKEITEVSDGKYTIEIWKYDSSLQSAPFLFESGPVRPLLCFDHSVARLRQGQGQRLLFWRAVRRAAEL